MSSVNVLKSIGDILIDYFSYLRKLYCFDLSSTKLPFRKYPPRPVRSLINYNTNYERPLKYYFNSYDTRKKISTFKPDNVDEARLKKVIAKLESYIKEEVKKRKSEAISKYSQAAPWNKYWYRTKYKNNTFDFMRLMQTYSNRQKRFKHQNIYNRYNPSIYALTYKKGHIIKDKPHMKSVYHKKWPTLYGSSPVLRTVPNPKATRGEAERVTKMAAKLLLITEYDPNSKKMFGGKKKLSIENSGEARISKYSMSSGKSVSSVDDRKASLRLIENKMKTKQSGSPESEKQEKLSVGTISTGVVYNKTPSFKIRKSSAIDSINLDNNIPAVLHKSEVFDYPDETSSIDKSVKEKSGDKTSSDIKDIVKTSIPCCSTKTKEAHDENSEKSSKKKKSSSEDSESSKRINTGVKFKTLDTTIETKKTMEIKTPVKSPRSDKRIDSFKTADSRESDDSYQTQSKNNVEKNVSNVNDKNLNQKTKPYKQHFIIKTTTGDRLGAGSNADIWLFMAGDRNKLPKSVQLKKSKTHCHPFGRGNIDEFHLKSSIDLGFLQSIQIGHDSDAPGSDWFLEKVEIQDVNMKYQYIFPCNRWLSIRTNDKMTRITLLYNPSDLQSQLSNVEISNEEVDIEEEYYQEQRIKHNEALPKIDAAVQYSSRSDIKEIDDDIIITGGSNRIRIVPNNMLQNKSNSESQDKTTKLINDEDENIWSDLMVEISQESLTELYSCFGEDYNSSMQNNDIVNGNNLTNYNNPEIISIDLESDNIEHEKSVNSTITKYDVQTRNISHGCLSFTENMSSKSANIGSQKSTHCSSTLQFDN